MGRQPAICDYSDTDYERDFWAGGHRAYEDRVERLAIGKLFPSACPRFLEIGAGYGRLLDAYERKCRSVTLVDYAPNMVGAARKRVKDLRLSHVEVLQGDAYDLSPLSGTFDGCMMVRVLHHIEDVGAVFAQIHAKLKRDGFFILEYPNKRNIVEIVRAAAGKNNLRPFSPEPGRRGKGPFCCFHPSYVEQKLHHEGFGIERVLMVSAFRHVAFKRLFGSGMLSAMENAIQEPLGFLRLSPSVFVLARKASSPTRLAA